MRLIDANQLSWDWYDWFYYKYGVNCADDFKAFVNDADIIECRERGEWIKRDIPPDINGKQIYYCSKCGQEELLGINDECNFCCHCGAIMKDINKVENPWKNWEENKKNEKRKKSLLCN